MSEITVSATTQRIVVDPAGESVSVIHAGPIGPAGVPGPSEASLVLDTNGQILTRAAGDLAPITRAALAADTAWASLYAKQTVAAGDPVGTGSDGDIHWDTTAKRLWRSDGTDWIVMAEPWQTYTPALTASTTNPTLGTGAQQLGKYRRSDGNVEFFWFLQFGSSMSAGAGNYRVGAPMAIRGLSRASNAGIVEGNCSLYDNNTANFHSSSRLLVGTAGDSYLSVSLGVGGAIAALGAAIPWTWAQSDEIEGWAKAEMHSRYS